MPKYADEVRKSFAPFKGIVDYPETVAQFDELLQNLESAGFEKLVKNVVKRQGNAAMDIMLEGWLIQMLRRNPYVRDLVYEPEDMGGNAPDLRFWIGDVRFDMQVKRLYGIKNAQDKAKFQTRFDERAETIPFRGFLHFWLSDEFKVSDIDDLFYYIKKELDQKRLSPVSLEQALSLGYHWPPTAPPKDAKARFSLQLANSSEKVPHIHIGTIWYGEDLIDSDSPSLPLMAEAIDPNDLRKAVRRQLEKSRHTLTLEPGSKQANIVVVQPSSSLSLWTGNDTFAEAFYGDEIMLCGHDEAGTFHTQMDRKTNGLFASQYSKMCGVIVVPSSIWPLSEDFEGTYFPHPSHLTIIPEHPRPFPEMMYHIEQDWPVTGNPKSEVAEAVAEAVQ